MVIGPSQCGKTTLVRALEEDDRPLRRTPDLIYGKRTMDCPGSYVENADMYKHLIAASQDASHVLILIDQSGRSIFIRRDLHRFSQSRWSASLQRWFNAGK